ncbi:lytic murein transglycosylase [Paraglaciecola aquimarina]|uniref:Lytic murein transglycosylase n=1 Tax=Paraglaciecola aquimarina TaxID=1235557 RepID=A0ABU3SX89_9ALTE|nr:lytic murein transglycosylase [Paraglaciecola aquimarina]MDU0354608.1 lytic murein transglycosylase [Paraglaciecola aquimarina]
MILLFTFCLLTQPVHAKIGFADYVHTLKSEAIEKGYPASFVEQVFANVKLREKVVKADKNQPETKITLDNYLATRVPDWKVQKAVQLMNDNEVILEQVEAKYGVQKRFIVALWGNESNFGSIQGKHPVISSLVSLAYDGRRETLFKKQLFAALDILQQGHVSQQNFLGSWAGAMGQSQFMPTSFLDYAVDFDGDGKKDIWTTKADVFASIANFLKSEGWSDKLTWGRQVKIPSTITSSLIGLDRDKRKTLKEWQELNITRYSGRPLPVVDLSASLLAPDGLNGRIYLVYENFHTLMKWNRSSYFGISVSYLSDRIKKGF